ncbi:putative inner membrane transporter YhbE [compost metagenome]
MNGRTSYLLLIVATCIWGGNFVAGKAIVAELPPITLALFRWGIALICLLPWYGKQAWDARIELAKQGKMILALSLTGVVGFNTLTYIAVQYTGSINASLMNSATPILIVIISWLMFRERMKWKAGIGIMLSMAGVIWIIGRGSWSVIGQLSFNAGDLWMLLAVTCWAFYSVGMKKISGLYHSTLLLFSQIAIAIIVLVPASLIELSIRKPTVHYSVGLTAGLLYVGIFASLIAFSAWNRAIRELGPARCAGFLNLIPMFSAIFATLFAGEHIQLYHLIGAIFIIGGVYMTNRIIRQSSAPTSSVAKANSIK